MIKSVIYFSGRLIILKFSTKDANKEKILGVVLKYISENETHQITIREIARLAGVNSAAISYYFGSKDNLIQEACKHYYDLGNKIFEEIEANDGEPRDKLKRFFMNYTNHMFKFPGFLKAQISQYINETQIQNDVVAWLQSNCKILSDCIGKATKETNPEILYFKAIQLLSNIVYPFLLNKYSCAFGGLNFGDEAVRSKYIDTMLDGIL